MTVSHDLGELEQAISILQAAGYEVLRDVDLYEKSVHDETKAVADLKVVLPEDDDD